MQLGIIGFPQCGKTTIFNALTRGTQPTGFGSGKMEIHTAVVDVPDKRVDILNDMFHPRKKIYTKVTYVDIIGLESSTTKEGVSGALLNRLTQLDGFIHVARCFEDENVPHPAGSVNPSRDLTMMDSEFILNDLIAVERKLERLMEEKKKGAGREKAQVDREIALFEKLQTTLSEETLLRNIELTAEDEKILSGFGFLSRKPVLVVLNLSEGQPPPAIEYKQHQSQVISLQGRLEMDLAQLSPEEAEEFLKEYNLGEPVLNRLIKISYDLLGLISFFTVGEDEVRAWTVHQNATAPVAAGEIHTDLQKGFIRAEVVAYKDLIAAGSMAEARNQGKWRLEGKEYPVQDGDILNIRFNI